MFWLACALSYLLGSVPGSLLLGRLRGVDIRKHGSGNAGATNALRTQGKGFALATVLIDVGKGVIASLLLARLATELSAPYACALAAVIGHCFPVFYGFRGGKGAGTALGALALLLPSTALSALLIWLFCLLSTGYVGLSTVFAALTGVAGVVWLSPLNPPALYYAMATFLLVALMHHGNIRRLWLGTEHRFEKARLWRYWKRRS